MLDYRQLEALAAVHRRGSFERAAAALGLSQSAVSQRIKTLEDQIGELLIRRGHPCLATEAGLRLIRHLDEVSLLEHSLTTELPGSRAAPGTPPPTLRIAVNADSLATWVIPALARIDGVLFDLVIADQDVSQDWLRRGEVRAAITSHPGPLQGCDTLALGRLRYRATASPDFIRRWLPNGVSAPALASAPAINFSSDDRLQTQWLARHLGLSEHISHQIGSSHAFIDAALCGLGWGMNPEVMARPHLDAGRLVELIADTPLDTPLYWQFARINAGALAPLTREIRNAAAAHLLPPEGAAAPG